MKLTIKKSLTEEEAKFEVKRREIFEELRQYAKPFLKGYRNNYLFYDYNINVIAFDYTSSTKCNCLCFGSDKKYLEQVIEKVGKDRIKKYYLGVE